MGTPEDTSNGANLTSEYHDIGDDKRLSTGIPGLDDVLNGGLPVNHLYLVQGTPGTGKTTLAIQFLRAGAAAKESCLYVTLAETKQELRAISRSHRWSIAGVEIFQALAADPLHSSEEREYTLFHPSDVELAETIESIMAAVRRLNPDRVVIDSLSELRVLSVDKLRYRRQILALKQALVERSCTVLLLDDLSDTDANHLHSIAHGVIALEQIASEYGRDRRRLRVIKMRGVAFREGYHDFQIRTGGQIVYPRLVAAEHHPVSSDIKDLDKMLGGGLHKGTSTVLLGPAGAGKTTFASQFALAAAKRGEHAAMYIFDEGLQTFFARAAGLGMDIEKYVHEGLIKVQQVDPAELSPGEFAHSVRQNVELTDAKVIVIDSLNGYLHAMPDQRYLLLQMHELLMYLNQRGVVSMLVIAQHGLDDNTTQSPIDLSYLVDSVIRLRYIETNGEIRRALSILKKRPGAHDHTIREYRLGTDTITIGETFRGAS
jgi:circadian clock protein KaiC